MPDLRPGRGPARAPPGAATVARANPDGVPARGVERGGALPGASGQRCVAPQQLPGAGRSRCPPLGNLAGAPRPGCCAAPLPAHRWVAS
eukprot:311660-Alexandrium_andersonii.AAC.1